MIKLNVSKRARLAHVALLGSLLAYGAGSYMARTEERSATPAGEYTTLLRSEEAKGVIKSMEKHRRRNALKRFNSLADFTNEYINILKRDRVQNLNNLQEFVIRLHNRHYFVGESVGSYKHKLEWHLSFVQAASRERNLFFGDLRWNGKELNMQEQVPVQERAAGELWHSFSEHSRDVPISMPRALIRY